MKREEREKVQREGFLKACSKLHQKLSRPLSLEQKEAFDELWGENKHDEIVNVSALIYKLGRNTMAHGYQSRGVYLTEGIEDFEMASGALNLNPFGFWSLYLHAYDRLWEEFLKIHDLNHPYLKSMRLYRDSLLN